MPMSTLACYISLFSILFTINRPTSGRPLDHGDLPPPSPPQQPPPNTYQRITFCMGDVLGNGNPSAEPEPEPAGTNNQLPFPKPRGLFPPVGGIPLPEPNTDGPGDHPGESFSSWFPYLSSLQALEFGDVTAVDEELRETGAPTSPLVGRAQGLYVTIPEETGSHMMAMTAKFADGEPENSIRFFGIHQTGAAESHVAVIGGTGKYEGANGYATVMYYVRGPDSNGVAGPSKKNLLVTVFLI